MEFEKTKTVAIIGFRHDMFNFPLYNNSYVYTGFKNTVFNSIWKLNQAGYNTFIYGGESGFEIICAEMIKVLKRKTSNIKLVCALPYAAFPTSEHLEGEWKNRYISASYACDSILNVTRQDMKHKGCYRNRYEYMTDNSNILLCYNDSPKSSMSALINYMMGYALASGLEILNAADLI